MGIQYRRRVRTGKNSWLNISKSGVSESVRVGRTTFNTRGSVWVRLAKGLSYRKRAR